MSPNSALRSFLLAAGSSLLAISYAHAADGTWDTNSGGNWTDVTKWLGDTAYASGADFTATLGNFISADSIINLDANITIGNITASDATHNYTISGASILTLDRTSPDVPVIDVTTSSRTLTISSEISGSDGLQKNGAGTLVLGSTTSSSLSGNINIAAGALSARFSALGSGNLVFTGNSSFTKIYNTPGTATTGFSINDGVTATIGGSTFYYNFTTTGALVGNSSAKLVISTGANTEKNFNSTSNTFAGELTLGGGGTADNGQRTGFKSLADSSQKIIINDALFRLNNGGVSMNFANRVLEMTGNARLDNDSTSSSVTLSFAQDLSVKTGNNARLLTLSGVNTGDNTFSGVIGNSSTGTGKVSVTKSEAGKWILGGANTYTGDTTVSAGLLEIGGSGSLGSGNYAANISVASTNAGTLKFNSSASQSLGGVISGAGALVKDNIGVLTLTNDNTYTGATTVDGGTLLINGSTSSTSLVTVNNGGILGGTGTVGGSVTLNEGAFLSPGASIESLSSGNNTWNGGATVIFEFSTDGSSGTAGSQWDLLGITGTLDLTGATSINPINLNLITMADALNSGLLASWNANTNALWSGFVTTTGGITGFAANLFDIDTTGFQNGLNGSFSVAQNGNNLDLVYTAIPEPRAALLGGLGLLMLLRRRR